MKIYNFICEYEDIEYFNDKLNGKNVVNVSFLPEVTDELEQRGIEFINIDNLLSDLGIATTKEVKRSDGLVHGKLSPMTMTDDKGNEVLLSGTRDPEKVSRIVNSHTDAIQYCYLREVKRNPNLRGKVVVRFTIRPDGTVSDVKILSTTLRSDSAERCIISRIKRWDDFDPIDPGLGDATFRQVYTFGF